MKNKTSILIFVLCPIISFYSCQKEESSGDVTEKTVVTLLKKISRSPSGIKIKAKKDSIEVSKKTEDEFIITLRKPKIHFDLSVLRKLDYNLNGIKIPIDVEKIVLLYFPDDQYLKLLSYSNFSIDHNFADLIRKANRGTSYNPIVKFNFFIGKVEFEKMNISSLLSKKPENFKEFINLYSLDNSSEKSKIENLQVDLHISERSRKVLSFVMSFDELSGKSYGSPGFAAAIYQDGGDKKVLTDFLSRGEKAFDLSGNIKNFKFFILKNGKKISSGRIGEATFLSSLKPDEDKQFYVYESSANFKDFNFSLPGKEILNLITQADECNINFSAFNLSAGAIQSYVNMSNFKWDTPYRSHREREHAVSLLRTQLISEFLKSQPYLKISISPFKHRFGEAFASGELRFVTVGPPVGKITITLKNLSEIKTRIISGLPVEMAERIIYFLKDIMIINEPGDGVLKIEKKIGQSQGYYLNGKPGKL